MDATSLRGGGGSKPNHPLSTAASALHKGRGGGSSSLGVPTLGRTGYQGIETEKKKYQLCKQSIFDPEFALTSNLLTRLFDHFWSIFVPQKQKFVTFQQSTGWLEINYLLMGGRGVRSCKNADVSKKGSWLAGWLAGPPRAGSISL